MSSSSHSHSHPQATSSSKNDVEMLDDLDAAAHTALPDTDLTSSQEIPLEDTIIWDDDVLSANDRQSLEVLQSVGGGPMEGVSQKQQSAIEERAAEEMDTVPDPATFGEGKPVTSGLAHSVEQPQPGPSSQGQQVQPADSGEQTQPGHSPEGQQVQPADSGEQTQAGHSSEGQQVQPAAKDTSTIPPATGTPAADEESVPPAPKLQKKHVPLSGKDLKAAIEAKLKQLERKRKESTLAEHPPKRTKNDNSGETMDVDVEQAVDNSLNVIQSRPMEVDNAEAEVATGIPDCKAIKNPSEPMKCALQYQDGDVIGNPFQPIKGSGWNMRLHFDGGRYGQPSIKIVFRFNKKGHKTEDIARALEDTEAFSVSWQLGVKIAGQDMIEKISLSPVGEGLGDETTDWRRPKTIIRGAPNITAADKLAVFELTCNGHEVSSLVSKGWYSGFGKDVEQTMNALLNGTGQYKLRVWFMIPNRDMETFREMCYNAFETAVVQRLPPLYQYRDPRTGEVNIDVATLPVITEFKNGMYMKKRKDGVSQIVSLPKKLAWSSVEEFYIYYGVAIVRELQWQIGLVGWLERKTHHAFILKVPRLSNVPSEVKALRTKDQARLDLCFYVFIRIQADKDGYKETAPSERTRMQLDWHHEVQGVHIPSEDKSDLWFGEVLRVDDWKLKNTGTDFCLFMSKPAGKSNKPAHNEIQRLSDGQLHKCHLYAKANPGPANRELKALEEFCFAENRPDLGPVRDAVVGKPSNVEASVHDLATGPSWDTKHLTTERIEAENERKRSNVDVFNKRLDFLQSEMNTSQFTFMEEHRRITNKLKIVAGPPGTGKTEAIVQSTKALLEVGHQILATAPSNSATDHSADAMYRSLRTELEVHGALEDKKILRLEALSIEDINLLKYNRMDEQNSDDPMQQEDESEAWLDHPEYTHAMNEALVQYAENEEKFQVMLAQGKSFAEAVAALARPPAERQQNYPAAMSLSFRIWEACQLDSQRWVEAKKRDREIWPDEEDPLYKDALGKYATNDKAYRDQSRGYRALIEKMASGNSRLSRKDRKAYERERKLMLARIISASQIIFTTCGNSGLEVIVDYFKPSVVYIDEAGQATVSTACVPMASHRDVNAFFLVGDIQQNIPVVINRASEVSENATISMLYLLQKKAAQVTLLDTQYRMAPEISRFPNQEFYHGRLRNDDSTLVDNKTRKAARKISREYYGIKGPNGNGNEYWVIDVTLGQSRIESNGTSLQNFANAAAVKDLVDHFLEAGVKADKIAILSWYKGQNRITRLKMERDADGSKSYIKRVTTVDAFQGHQSDVVIADCVAAGPEFEAEAAEEEADGDDGAQAVSSKKYSVLTAHMKSPNRLCVSVTRARYAFVMIAKVATIRKGIKANKAGHSLQHLIADAAQRKLIFHDSVHMDDHPEVAEELAALDEKARKEMARRAVMVSQGYSNDLVKQRHKASARTAGKVMSGPEIGPRYRTRLGHISRNFGSDDTILNAEKADNISRQGVSGVPKKPETGK